MKNRPACPPCGPRRDGILGRIAAGHLWPVLLAGALVLAAPAGPATAQPAPPGADQVLAAREALRTRDRVELEALRDRALASENPLASWIDYWALSSRLDEASPDDVQAFYQRWPGTYVEDRLRNDWLLVLGKRGDWARIAAEHPRFRMNDDRDVTCWALLAQHRLGRGVSADAALQAWLAQRDADEACRDMAAALFDAGVLEDGAVWRKVHLAAEQNRKRAATTAAALLGAPVARAVDALWDDPARYLRQHSPAIGRSRAELLAMAAVRLGAAEPAQAAGWLERPALAALPRPQRAWAWYQVGRQGAQRLLPESLTWYRYAVSVLPPDSPSLDITDEVLAWQVRAALRADPKDWRLVHAAVAAMSDSARADSAWAYWQARAVAMTAPAGTAGDARRAESILQLEALSGQMSFYGKLAAEDLDRPLALPPRPSPLTAAEIDEARRHPGLSRALLLLSIGLRSEGVREWNFSLRGMGDRQLLAAAQRACDAQVWDRCINTSERTRELVDVEQRFPLPFREQVVAQAREAGVDPAYVYGLIRQESRFILDARSSVGASGLMQLMPATARWTARKIGLPFTPDMVNDRDVNLKLGTAYLKLVLDDFDGSQALAAAAYNAGPGRPRRWREGPTVEAAAWAESIPFSETRDYVKKVLSNAAYYAVRLDADQAVTLKARLGETIGPRVADAPPANRDLP